MIEPEEIPLSDLQTIQEALCKFNISQRLKNIILKEDFPFTTFTEYFSNKNNIEKLMSVQNMGRKSATEFIELVEQVLKNRKDFYKHQLQDDVTSTLNDNLININHVLLHQNISNRLRHILNTEEMPFITFVDYQNCPDKVERLRKVPRLGLSTAKEYIQLVDQILNNKNIIEGIYSDQKQLTDKIEYLQTLPSIKDYFLRLDLSVRLRNAIQNDFIPFTTFKEYFDCADKNRLLLQSKNMGKKTVKEFTEYADIIINNPHPEELLGEVNTNNEFIEIFGPNGENGVSKEKLYEAIKKILPKRNYQILSARFGIDTKRSYTLDELAVHFNVTRERIRQIEAKSIDKLRILNGVSKKYIEEISSLILVELFYSTNYFHMSQSNIKFKRIGGENRLLILLAYSKIQYFLNEKTLKYKKHYIKADLGESSIDLIKNIIDSGNKYPSLRERLEQALTKCSYPIKLAELKHFFADLTIKQLWSNLNEEFDSQFNKDHLITINPEKISSSTQAIIILRYVGKAITVKEAQYYYKTIFNQNIREHNITATFGRVADIILIGRGKYALLDQVGIGELELTEIKQTCFDYLKEKREYISTKKIYADLFDTNEAAHKKLNPYLLLGLLVDDSRFVSKRGFMVSLKEFSEIDVPNLTENVIQMVENYGPIKITDIQEKLADTRRTLYVTIAMILNQAEDILKVSPATYCSRRKLLKDSEYSELIVAMNIALIDGNISMFTLRERIQSTGKNYDMELLKAIIDKQKNLKRTKSIISQSSYSKEIKEYQKYYKDCLSNSFNTVNQRYHIKQMMMKFSPKMAKLDWRLFNEQLPIKEDVDELDSLIGEFI